MDKIAEFVMRKRVVTEPKKTFIAEVKTITPSAEEKPKLPWYKQPIEREAFSYKEAKNGKLYMRHREWSEKIWIGPYNTPQDINSVINSYILESLKAPLDRKRDSNVHSLIIENETDFFKNAESKKIL